MRVGFAAFACLVLAAPAWADPFDEAEEARIGELVREYIIAHPELIEEALIEAIARGAEREARMARDRVAAESAALFDDSRDFAVGPEDAPVTIVEFFDYNCGFCRGAAAWLKTVIDEHGDNVRVVFKEAPFLPSSMEHSRLAAETALAAKQQDRYLDVHFAMMEVSGMLTSDRVNAIAREQGLNMRWLTNARDDEAIAAHLADTRELGARLGMRGTPYFVVNGEPVEGFDETRLQQLVDAALALGE